VEHLLTLFAGNHAPYEQVCSSDIRSIVTSSSTRHVPSTASNNAGGVAVTCVLLLDVQLNDLSEQFQIAYSATH